MAKTDSYEVTGHVPEGIILDRTAYASLMDAWAANGGEALSTSAIEAITGSAAAAPTIKRSFPTGAHPAAVVLPFGGPRF